MLQTGKHVLTAVLLFAMLIVAGCATSTSTSISASQSAKDMPPLLRTRLDAATEYLRKGNHRGARDHLQKALEIDRTEPEVYDLLALLYYRELEYGLAEKNYRKAIALDRHFTRGYNNFGSFLYGRQRYEEACGYLQTASTDVDYPLRASVFTKLGQCLQQVDKQAEAAEAFQRSVALSPRNPPAYLELADLAFQAGEYPQAKQYWNYYNRLKQKPSARGLWLGVRLEHVFEDKDARDSHGLALTKLYPDSQESLDYKAWQRNEYKAITP